MGYKAKLYVITRFIIYYYYFNFAVRGSCCIACDYWIQICTVDTRRFTKMRQLQDNT